ncbi:MAG: hypothetical protein ACI4MI_05945 [Christensenellales bacterium]
MDNKDYIQEYLVSYQEIIDICRPILKKHVNDTIAPCIHSILQSFSIPSTSIRLINAFLSIEFMGIFLYELNHFDSTFEKNKTMEVKQ